MINEDFVDHKEEHDFWEIVYIESGEALISADLSEFLLLSGEAFFHKPGQAHSIKAINGPINVFFISFYSSSKFMAIFEDLKISLSKEQKKLVNRIYDEARNIFEKGTRSDDADAFVSKALLENSPLGSQQLYKLYLEEFLLLSAREAENEKNIVTYDSKENLEKIIVERIIEVISERVYSSLTIDELCASLNYSRTYLSNLFKSHRKTSVMNYYNMLKIKEAKKLIRDRGYSVSETARMLSFSNPYYFSKVFKRYEGISPSEYKAKSIKE
jgi:YesN/AraC family two-component response regulator